jgi:RNA polymerase sigma-70 factor, ECF subfamily
MASVRHAVEVPMLADQAMPGASRTQARPVVPAKTPTDIALLTRMSSGDTLAMQAFYARHNVRVFRFVLRIVGDHGVAEDVISETFLDAWRQADRFEGRSAASTWLLAIARHKAYAALRRRGNMTALTEEVTDQIEDCADTPDTTVEKDARGRILRRCLDELTPAHREIIDLVYYHEKSLAEVAQIVAIPENTVKTRLFYARKRLATLARNAGIDRDWL